MKNQNPLAHQHDIRSLLRFAAPSIGMMLMISLYTVTDGIFIGRYAGSEALAASNIVYPAVNLVLGLAIMLAAGKVSTVLAAVIAAIFMVGLFVVLWLRGRSQRKKGL